MEDIARAWAAGIIDGEGCIFIARRRPPVDHPSWSVSYVLGVKVTMGHEGTILRLRSMFGSGSKHTVAQVGWNPAYTWLVQAQLAKAVIEAIEPYAITKAAEIAVAQEFTRLPGWGGGRQRGVRSSELTAQYEAIWDRMRRLKPRTAYRLAHEEVA